MKRWAAVFVAGVGLAWACGFDGSLREYLSVSFWSPFMRRPADFERPNIRRANTAYAGMGPVSATALGKLRAEYRQISQPREEEFDTTTLRAAVQAARVAAGMSARDREEVELIDAKIDMRAGDQNRTEPLKAAVRKFDAFLKTAKTPEWLSEARGWLAYTHVLLGEPAAAGKLYLDELNRDGSNIGRDTLLKSLAMTFGPDGELELRNHLDEYFDTPEHAVFAIQMVTNPRQGDEAEFYKRVNALLLEHRDLLAGSQELPLLIMRTALRMGDPAGAIQVAEMLPAGSSVRKHPDYLWMLGSAHYVAREYEEAAAPLVELFGSLKDNDSRKAAAAYGLVGAYQKTGNWVEQIRFAGWVGQSPSDVYSDGSGNERNFGIYWASSGWDLNLLLDVEAPDEALWEFIAKYPDAKNVRLVKYALAVRLAREDKYADSAEIYEDIGQRRRGPRMRELAALWMDGSTRSKYEFAKVLTEHADGVYFNDSIWWGRQRYALIAETESRFTKEEREQQIAKERELRDQQEEHWRAYKILRDVMEAEGPSELGRKAALLAQKNVRMIATDRFGRQDEVAQADRDIAVWLRAR